MTKCEFRTEEDFRNNGFRVMNRDKDISIDGISEALVLMRGRETFLAYKYKKSGIFSRPIAVR